MAQVVTWYLTPMTRTSSSDPSWDIDPATTEAYAVWFGTSAEFQALPDPSIYDIKIIDVSGDGLVGATELRSALLASTAPRPSNNQGYLGTHDVNLDADPALEASAAYALDGGITSSTNAVLITVQQLDPSTTQIITTGQGYQGGIGNFDPYNPGTLRPPCFVTGTLLDTPEGPRPVETLAVGDLILTADHGAVPLRLVLSAPLDASRLARHPDLRPIRIGAGTLGAGLPRTDLLVSPQHRILVRSRIAQRMFGTDEVLVAAKQLLQIEGIDIATDLTEFRYYHLVFDRHEILWSNGTESESLYPGPETLRHLGHAARNEIYALFPDLRDANAEAIISARILTSGRQARKLAHRHLQNRMPLMSSH